MRKRNAWLLAICAAILFILIFFEPSYGWALRRFLSPSSSGQADTPTLTAENETLAAQLAELKNIQSEIPSQPANDIRAMVYSRYPLNFKNEILVNAGSNDGVAVGKAVTFQGILIGSVEKTFSDSSLVETMFDSNVKIPVRVGSGGYDALLTGGAYPELTSIEKNTPIEPGDIVYSAAPGFPYDLPVGIVAATSTSPDNLFEQATLNFAYDINNIQTVLIAQ